ncbi:Rv1476 family membrane protein [Tsukamurella serpentis]
MGLPFVTEVPTDVDLAALEVDLADDGVAVLNPAHAGAVPQLAQVVRDAQGKGIENFKVIVLAHDYLPDTSLRDLGTQVGKDLKAKGQETATVLVMSPNQVAGYSTQLSRYQIESGQEGPTGKLALGNPPKAAGDFVDTAHGATFPWAAFTLALVLLVVALAAAVRVITRRRSRAVDAARRAAGLRPDGSATADGNGVIAAHRTQ